MTSPGTLPGKVDEEVIPGDRSGPPTEGGPRRPTNLIILVMVLLGMGIMYAGYLLSTLPPIKRAPMTYTVRHDSFGAVKDRMLDIGAGIAGAMASEKADAVSPPASTASASSPQEVKDGHVIPRVDYKDHKKEH